MRGSPDAVFVNCRSASRRSSTTSPPSGRLLSCDQRHKTKRPDRRVIAETTMGGTLREGIPSQGLSNEIDGATKVDISIAINSSMPIVAPARIRIASPPCSAG